MRSTESHITVTHPGNGTAGIIIYTRGHGGRTEALQGCNKDSGQIFHTES